MDREADLKFVRELSLKRLIDRDGYQAARKLLRPLASWISWAENMLLLLGSALVLAGIIFFFAYNWKAMGPFLKFGVIEACIVGCMAGGYFMKPDAIVGKLLVLSGCVITGVLMGVFGQTYQTGADAFELFVKWAILILPIVAVSRFAALWVTWLVILNTGIALYWAQVVEPVYGMEFEELFMLLAVVNTIALAAREYGALRKWTWLQLRWHRALLVGAVLVLLSWPAVMFVVEPGYAVRLVAFFCWVIAIIGCYYIYRRLLPDPQMLALGVLSCCTVVLTFIGKILFDVGDLDEWASLLMSGAVIAVVSAATVWLKKVVAEIDTEKEGRG